MFQQYPHYFHKVFNIFLEEIHHFDHVMDIWEYLARLFQNLHLPYFWAFSSGGTHLYLFEFLTFLVDKNIVNPHSLNKEMMTSCMVNTFGEKLSFVYNKFFLRFMFQYTSAYEQSPRATLNMLLRDLVDTPEDFRQFILAEICSRHVSDLDSYLESNRFVFLPFLDKLNLSQIKEKNRPPTFWTSLRSLQATSRLCPQKTWTEKIISLQYIYNWPRNKTWEDWLLYNEEMAQRHFSYDYTDKVIQTLLQSPLDSDFKCSWSNYKVTHFMLPYFEKLMNHSQRRLFFSSSWAYELGNMSKCHHLVVFFKFVQSHGHSLANISLRKYVFLTPVLHQLKNSPFHRNLFEDDLLKIKLKPLPEILQYFLIEVAYMIGSTPALQGFLSENLMEDMYAHLSFRMNILHQNPDIPLLKYEKKQGVLVQIKRGRHLIKDIILRVNPVRLYRKKITQRTSSQRGALAIKHIHLELHTLSYYA